MSLNQHAFIQKSRVPSRDAWQAAIDPLGFDMKIDHDLKPFESSGFLPCKLNGELSGFEIYYEPAAELLETYPDLQDKLQGRDFSISFRWGGRAEEGACVCIASAALCKSFDALIYYAPDAMIYTTEELLRDAALLIQDPEPPPPLNAWQRFVRRLRGAK